MNKALAFFMGTDCGGGRCEKCEGVFVQPRGMPLNPNPPSLGEGGPWFFGLLFATPTTRSSIYIHHYLVCPCWYKPVIATGKPVRERFWREMCTV